MGALAYWAVAAENDFSFYWRDPAAIVNTGPWIGLFSNIGVFIWWIAAVVAVFTALVLRRVPGQRRTVYFFLAWGVLSGILALDDFFMIHEWVVPTYLPLSDNFLFVVYFLVIGAMLIYFRREILQSRYPVLLLAFACVGLSTIIDVLGFEWFIRQGVPTRLAWNLEFVVEDGLKLVAIIAWTHYFALTCYESLVRAINWTAATPLKSEASIEQDEERVEVL